MMACKYLLQMVTYCTAMLCYRYSRNIDDNIITRGARLDDAMERLTNWNVIMKTIKIFYRVSDSKQREMIYSRYRLCD